MPQVNSFRDLEVWLLAMDLVDAVIRASRSEIGPPSEIGAPSAIGFVPLGSPSVFACFAFQSLDRYDAEVAAQPESVGSHAAENLRFIRHAMERSSTFTAIPGLGGVVMGAIALAAAAIAATQPTGDRWLLTWLGAAALAAVVGLIMMARKARAAGATLIGANARRFALGMAAPFVAGAAITYELWAVRSFTAMAPVWLLLYGVGLLTGGQFSVPVVRGIGVCFMAVGIAAILTPPGWGNAWLAIGFGGLQIGFGIHIARNHGG